MDQNPAAKPEKTIEAIYGVPNETPVVQVFVAGSGPQIGEISVVDGNLVFELFSRADGQSSSVSVDELLFVLRLARERLLATDT